MALRHPNVVRLLDADLEAVVPYLALELVEGEDLDAQLGPGRAPWDRDALEALARDLAAGLAALHGVGVVHRDLKPSNLIRTPSGRVVIADLGLATGRGYTRITGPRDLVGTPSYMPPEAFFEGGPNPASDVFQFGVLVYLAWFGEFPHALRLADGRLEFRISATRRQELAADPLGAVLLRCLSESPMARPGDGGALWEELTGTFPAPVPPSSPVPCPATASGGAARPAEPSHAAPVRSRAWLAGLLGLGFLAGLAGPRGAPPMPEQVRVERRGDRVTFAWTTDREAPGQVELQGIGPGRLVVPGRAPAA
jgi:serine/threonine protein kinase